MRQIDRSFIDAEEVHFVFERALNHPQPRLWNRMQPLHPINRVSCERPPQGSD